MLTRRIIACLDVRDGLVVKGVNFAGLQRAGDPAELAARYNRAGIDELIVLDITATLEGRRASRGAVSAVARELFIPLTAGGGIRSLADARAVIEAGADKVSINSAALLDPPLVSAISETYGSQATVVAIDARMTPAGYAVEVQPSWAGFPRGDLVADTARMNAQLQGFIDTMPDQYYWVHKRFKTRPPGEPKVY